MIMRGKCRWIALLTISAAALCAAGWPAESDLPELWPCPPFTVEGQNIVDATGRCVSPRGVNVGNKSSEDRHATWQSREHYLSLRNQGMTAVRYLIFWSAVEPESSQYDNAYLDAVARAVEEITASGLFVILDMHQDLFSAAIPGGNGAPRWAVARQDLPHWTPDGVWSLAYFTSPRLHAAWDAFWSNEPGPDGVGLQDHFARAWQHVAARFRNMPGVIGYDLLNEPMAGSVMTGIGTLALATLGQMSFQELGLALPDLIEQSMKLGYLPREALSMLESPDAYRTLFASIEPAIHHFEQTSVAGLYERVIAGIRSVDPDRIIFLEPTALVNAGAVSGLPLPSPPLSGPVAYLPHWYDLVLDTAIACEASKKRLGMAMDSRVQEAERMGLPLLIGEWGAFYNSPSCRDAGNMMAELLARNTVGDFYWDYHRNMEESPYRSALFRPAPIAVNGRGVRVELDFGQGTFRITWQEEQADRPASLIYVPAEWAPADILVDGRRLTGELAQLPYLKIEADPDRATREVLIRRKK